MSTNIPSLKQIQAEKARRSLLEFTKYTFPKYEVNWHHKALAKQLDRILSHDLTRLMVFMPPRYGKTELASRRFPAYVLGKNPDAKVIACSYAASLAHDINRDVQRIIDSKPYQELFPNTRLFGKNVRTSTHNTYLRNNDIFEIVGHRGFYKAAGVQGGITGKGYDIGIIDDPIKNAEQAFSPTYREKVWEWYTTTFHSRKEKGAAIILIMTRWHEDDLAGRLLSQDDDSEFAEDWKVIQFKAIKERPPSETPGDPRKEGTPLWPSKFTLDDVKKDRKLMGSRKFNALHQQKPHKKKEGALWNYDVIQRAVTHPDLVRIVVAVDPPISKGAESAEAGIIVAGVDAQGYGYVLEDASGKYSPGGWAKKTASLYDKWSADRIVAETNQGGDMVEHTVRSVDPMVAYRGIKATRGKRLRAEPIAAQYEQHKVMHVGNKFQRLEEQMCTWEPGSKSPDRIDALVYALTELFFYNSGKAKLRASTGTGR